MFHYHNGLHWLNYDGILASSYAYPAVAFIRLALLSKYPKPYLSQSLLAIFITHVVMSITLTLLLRLKAIIRSISTMNRIDYDSDDNDDQCDDRQVFVTHLKYGKFIDYGDLNSCQIIINWKLIFFDGYAMSKIKHNYLN